MLLVEVKTLPGGFPVRCWNGSVTQDTVVGLRSEIFSLVPQYKSARALGAILVELLQNVFLHGRLLNECPEATVLLIEFSDSWFLSVTNITDMPTAVEVNRRVRNYNALSASELREKMKSKRKLPINPEKGTAGLGLLDIIRKSGHTLVCSTKPHENDLVLLEMQTTISKETYV